MAWEEDKALGRGVEGLSEINADLPPADSGLV
jgi:hypothetical protein